MIIILSLFAIEEPMVSQTAIACMVVWSSPLGVSRTAIVVGRHVLLPAAAHFQIVPAEPVFATPSSIWEMVCYEAEEVSF